MILITLAGLYLNTFLENEIKQGLEKEYPASGLSYDEISVNAFAGDATIKNIKIKEGVFSLESKEVSLKDFSYTEYLKNENFTIGEVHLLDPVIILNKSDTITRDEDIGGDVSGREIRVKNFSATGGHLKMIENDSAQNSLYVSLQNLGIQEMVIQEMAEDALLPFNYETLNIESDSLFYDLNDTHYMQGERLSLSNEDLRLIEFSIIPKYSKEIFDQRIPYEQDWIALKIEEVNFKGVIWERIEEQVAITVPTTAIKNAHMEIYRNKLLPDDTRVKPMYSEMLRELDFKLRMDSLNIENTYIEYQEKVLESRPAGKLSFHNIQADIKNVSNRYLESEESSMATIEARALFMGETELTLNWSFDVSNEMDEFKINGRMGDIRAEHINSFLVPAMNVEAEGNIQSLYYDFYGNRNQANGNMQLSYRDFNVNILKDGESDRRSLLSRLANLIIRNDRINEDVQQENISTTRDKTKSFWNFLWLCIRDGALSTFF